MAQESTRIIGIDMARSFAICAAMLSHVLLTFDVYQFTPLESTVWMRFIIQMSPPIFISLFGAMLEVAYLPKVRAGQIDSVVSRLLVRAVQCYLLFGATVLALLITRADYTLAYAARTMLFMGATPFADILKFYTLALFLAPLILAMRYTWGLWPIFFIAIAINLVFPLLMSVPTPPELFDSKALVRLAGFFYGGGEGMVGGPSFLHGLSLVAWGMIVGRMVIDWRSEDPQRALGGALGLATLFLVSAAATFTMWDREAPLEMLRQLSNMTLRNENHPIYLTCGAAFVVASVVVCVIIYDMFRVQAGRGMSYIGRTSLFTFSFGNILLYLSPAWGRDLRSSLIMTGALFILICVQSLVFSKLQNPENDKKLALWFQSLIRRVTDILRDTVRAPSVIYGRLVSGWFHSPGG